MHSLKGAPFKLTMLHKMVPEARSVLEGQRVLGSVQLKVEAVRASGNHLGHASSSIRLGMGRIFIVLYVCCFSLHDKILVSVL